MSEEQATPKLVWVWMEREYILKPDTNQNFIPFGRCGKSRTPWNMMEFFDECCDRVVIGSVDRLHSVLVHQQRAERLG